MLEFEKNLFNKGIRYVAGVDEVGRGPLAGPMVACAVILDLDKLLTINDVSDDWDASYYSQITDSKKLSPKKRDLLEEFIKNKAISFSLAEISNRKLDEIGIAEATQISFFDSINGLSTKPNHILTDSYEIKKITKDGQTNIIRGDSKSISIAAASIVAKVYRDNLMIEHSGKHPEYGFEKHKGYGTKAHIDAIHKHGICPLHRKSFEPVKTLLKIL